MSATPMTTDPAAHDMPTGPRPPDGQQQGVETTPRLSGADLQDELDESRSTTRMAVLAVSRLAYALGQERAISDRLAALLAGAKTEAGVDLEDIEAALVAHSQMVEGRES